MSALEIPEIQGFFKEQQRAVNQGQEQRAASCGYRLALGQAWRRKKTSILIPSTAHNGGNIRAQ